MKQAEFFVLVGRIDAIAEMRGRQPMSNAAQEVWMRALASKSFADCERALDRFVTESPMQPTPADIIARLPASQKRLQHMGDSEAWAVAIKAKDEGATVVWTEEMCKAWATAKPVLDAGDEIGARAAFRDAYKRFVAESEGLGRPVRFIASMGHDKARRDDALRQAEMAGMLGRGDVERLGVGHDAASDLLRIGQESASTNAVAKECLQLLRKLVTEKTKPEPAGIDAEIERTRQKACEAMSKVADFSAAQQRKAAGQ